MILFILKICAGILLGWMSQKFYPQGNDYWGLNDAGWKEYQFMVHDPKGFFLDIFRSQYQNSYGGFFDSVNSYWNDLKNTLVGKLLAVLNIISRGNYYINSLFLNFIGFFGHVALYRVFIDVYKNKKWQVVAGCFLLPSALYFSSGIHRDLLVFATLGIYCYIMYFSLKNGFSKKYVLLLLLSFFALVILRNFVAVALIPATIALIISNRKNSRPMIIFTSTYITGILLLAVFQIVRPNFKPLDIITNKQEAFFELPFATSQIETRVLEPNLKSLLLNAPEALNHSFLRPYLWERATNFLIPLAVELFIYHLLFFMMLIFFDKKSKRHSFVVFGLFFSFSLMLFTGYIVPNTGSIVRYRSIYLPFIITPILCLIDWNKLANRINIKIKNI